VCDRYRITLEVARGPQHLDHALLSGVDGRTREPGVRLRGGRRLDARGWLRDEPTVETEDRPGGQRKLTPPGDISRVTERADHRDPGTLLGIGEMVGEDWHLDTEDRRAHGRTEQWLIALIGGMSDQRDAGRDQLGAGGLDIDRRGCVKPNAVVSPRALPVFEFSLRDGGTERDVPQRRRLGLVGLTPGQVVRERPL